MTTPTGIEATLEMILFWKITIDNYTDNKERDIIENTGWYLMQISACEDKITELERSLNQ